MRECSYWQSQIKPACNTDEEWLHQFIYPSEKHVMWQDVLPKRMLMSYKWDVLGMNRKKVKRHRMPYTCVYFFHGRPRPHEVKQFWHPRARIGPTEISTSECVVAGEAAV